AAADAESPARRRRPGPSRRAAGAIERIGGPQANGAASARRYAAHREADRAAASAATPSRPAAAGAYDPGWHVLSYRSPACAAGRASQRDLARSQRRARASACVGRTDPSQPKEPRAARGADSTEPARRVRIALMNRRRMWMPLRQAATHAGSIATAATGKEHADEHDRSRGRGYQASADERCIRTELNFRSVLKEAQIVDGLTERERGDDFILDRTEAAHRHRERIGGQATLRAVEVRR